MSYSKNYSAGVCYISSLYTDKIYIGSSKHIDSRIKIHARLLRDNKHPNKSLQEDYNLYPASFIWGVLEKTEDYKKREKFYITLLDSVNPIFGYNKYK